VEMGWISPYEMQWSVAKQIKVIIYSVFTWDSGEYRFVPSVEALDPDLRLELQTAEVIWEGARLVSDLKAVRAGLGAYSGVLQFARGRRLAIPISQKEGFILSRVDGRSTIADIVSSSPLGEEDSLRRIYALLLAGVLELTESAPPVPSKPESDAPPASVRPTVGEDERRFRDGVVARQAAMRFGNLYDRLGVDLGASTQNISEAYRVVLKSLEPEPHYRDQIKDFQPVLDKVRQKVLEAYRILVDPVRRKDCDKSLIENSPEATAPVNPDPRDVARELEEALSEKTFNSGSR
jgi:hypothetical protein